MATSIYQTEDESALHAAIADAVKRIEKLHLRVAVIEAERDRLTAENAALVAQLREQTEKASTVKHAQVLALTEERDALTAERNRLRDALHMCDVVMDTAAMHGLPQQLPPAYKESWASVHTNAREVLNETE